MCNSLNDFFFLTLLIENESCIVAISIKIGFYVFHEKKTVCTVAYMWYVSMEIFLFLLSQTNPKRFCIVCVCNVVAFRVPF